MMQKYCNSLFPTNYWLDSLLQYTWHNDAKAIQCIIRIVLLVDSLLQYTWHNDAKAI